MSAIVRRNLITREIKRVAPFLFRNVRRSFPSKADRVKSFFTELGKLPPAASGLEAYAQIANLLNSLEDKYGIPWRLPRLFDENNRDPRLYPPQPHYFHKVEDFPGLMAMVHSKSVCFISPMGAIEFQKRDRPFNPAAIDYSTSTETAIFKKPDAYGKGVWDQSPRRLTVYFSPELTEEQNIL
jgi:hypothetical protein